MWSKHCRVHMHQPLVLLTACLVTGRKCVDLIRTQCGHELLGHIYALSTVTSAVLRRQTIAHETSSYHTVNPEAT